MGRCADRRVLLEGGLFGGASDQVSVNLENLYIWRAGGRTTTLLEGFPGKERSVLEFLHREKLRLVPKSPRQPLVPTQGASNLVQDLLGRVYLLLHDRRLAQKLTGWLAAFEKRVVARKVRTNRGHVRASGVAADDESLGEGYTEARGVLRNLRKSRH